MANVVTFGEIMLRPFPAGEGAPVPVPPAHGRFRRGRGQRRRVPWPLLGYRSRWVSVVPSNPVGEAAVRELRRFGVDTGFVVRGGRRLGIYFAETGADVRASEVIYDREGSGIAEAKAGDIDWEAMFAGMDWFHVSGITPALSASAAGLDARGGQGRPGEENDRIR